MRVTLFHPDKTQEVISNVRKLEYANGHCVLTYGGKKRPIPRGVNLIAR